MNATRQVRRGIRSAFTLIEMLVVMIIIVILLGIAVPSFQAILSSSESALAETMLKAGMRAGRDAALRSSGDRDSAVVFFFEPGGQCSMVVCVKAGTLLDEDGAGNTVAREVFAPSPVNQPIQLPRGWSVRGYAPAYSIGVSNNVTLDANHEWYESNPGRPLNAQQGNWVFPETGFYNTTVNNDGFNRQSFMVRFQAGSGLVKIADTSTVLVVAPGPYAAWRGSGVFSQHRADQAEDLTKFVQRVLTAPTSLSDSQRRQLIGLRASDSVLCRAVSQLVLYEERELARGLGVRADRDTSSLYQPFVVGASSAPELVAGADVTARNINRWVTGDTNFDGRHRSFNGVNREDVPNTRVFALDRATGTLLQVEVEP
ncbi:MAG: type II secretion system protein [Phycisphaeraceae bacterium]|nr:type II secretion system protein [Phycisphaeraceae bacterium]